MLEVIRSFWCLTLTFYLLYFCIFQFKLLRFECLKWATSFSVWGYAFRISKSPLSFKVTALMSRLQNSSRAQVCAPLGHSLIVSVRLYTERVRHNIFGISICVTCAGKEWRCSEGSQCNVDSDMAVRSERRIWWWLWQTHPLSHAWTCTSEWSQVTS